jgi:hypothetical protein
MGNKAGNRMRDRVSDIAEYGRHKSRRQSGRHKRGTLAGNGTTTGR